MTDVEWSVFWGEFAATITGEAQVPIEARIRVAVTAGLRALAPDQLLERRAERIIDATATKHGTTSAYVRSSSRVANVVAAREESAAALTGEGCEQRDVARLLGRASHCWVAVWIRNHEARAAAAGDAFEANEAIGKEAARAIKRRATELYKARITTVAVSGGKEAAHGA